MMMLPKSRGVCDLLQCISGHERRERWCFVFRLSQHIRHLTPLITTTTLTTRYTPRNALVSQKPLSGHLSRFPATQNELLNCFCVSRKYFIQHQHPRPDISRKYPANSGPSTSRARPSEPLNCYHIGYRHGHATKLILEHVFR